jgi:hypothetical protein
MGADPLSCGDPDERGYYIPDEDHPKDGGAMNDPLEEQALNKAVEDLVAEMVRVKPELFEQEAREVIRGTVEHLLRDAGKVD